MTNFSRISFSEQKDFECKPLFHLQGTSLFCVFEIILCTFLFILQRHYRNLKSSNLSILIMHTCIELPREWKYDFKYVKFFFWTRLLTEFLTKINGFTIKVESWNFTLTECLSACQLFLDATHFNSFDCIVLESFESVSQLFSYSLRLHISHSIFASYLTNTKVLKNALSCYIFSVELSFHAICA